MTQRFGFEAPSGFPPSPETSSAAFAEYVGAALQMGVEVPAGEKKPKGGGGPPGGIQPSLSFGERAIFFSDLTPTPQDQI